MRQPAVVFLELTLPVLIALVALITVWSKIPVEVELVGIKLGVLSLEPVIKDRLAVRLIFSAVVIAGATFVQSVRDYSKFFPNHLEFDVYFDRDGIEDSLKSIPDRDRINVVAEGWQDDHPDCLEYFAKRLTKNISKLRGRSVYLDRDVQGSGLSSFRLEKTSGRQTYHITEAWGVARLNLNDEAMNATLWVPFSLKPTPSDHIRLSPADIFLRFSKVTSVTFTQYGDVRPSDEAKIADLVVTTHFRVFPIMRVSNSVYCIEWPATTSGVPSSPRRLVPIAYAHYKSA